MNFLDKNRGLVLLAAFNAALLVANGFFIVVLRGLGGRMSGEMNALGSQTARLEGLRTRFDSRIGTLVQLEDRIRDSVRRLESIERQRGLADGGRPAPLPEPAPASPSLLAQPPAAADPYDVDLLSDAEKVHLQSLRSAMPEVGDQVLMLGDPDQVLQDRGWNPTGRELSPSEREELAARLERIRFYARKGPVERFRSAVQPEVERLRSLGAFIEYTEEEDPPAIPGVLISHAEPSDRPGLLRLYSFYEADYPELYHQVQIERERSFEEYVKIYYLINPVQ